MWLFDTDDTVADASPIAVLEQSLLAGQFANDQQLAIEPSIQTRQIPDARFHPFPDMTHRALQITELLATRTLRPPARNFLTLGDSQIGFAGLLAIGARLLQDSHMGCMQTINDLFQQFTSMVEQIHVC